MRLDGTELRNWDRRQFGEFTGYLPQEVELFPGTIKDNVCRMRDDLPDEKIYEAAVFTDVHEMISQLPNGYETIMERSGAPLSGGQKQRIALARAFFDDPALIVLDEPNSNLDSTGEQALTDTLQRAKEKRITVIVITQRPAVLNGMDKLLILRAGGWRHLVRRAKSWSGWFALQRACSLRRSVGTGNAQPQQPRPAKDSKGVSDDSWTVPRIDQWHRDVQQSARGPIAARHCDAADLGCGFGAWAAIAPLASAVVASGSFVATGQNKQVQHLEGGIIREMLVKEGDLVEANQPLLRLDDTAANPSSAAWCHEVPAHGDVGAA